MKRFSYIFLVLTAASVVMPARAATTPVTKPGWSATDVCVATVLGAIGVAGVALLCKGLYDWFLKPSEAQPLPKDTAPAVAPASNRRDALIRAAADAQAMNGLRSNPAEQANGSVVVETYNGVECTFWIEDGIYYMHMTGRGIIVPSISNDITDIGYNLWLHVRFCGGKAELNDANGFVASLIVKHTALVNRS